MNKKTYMEKIQMTFFRSLANPLKLKIINKLMKKSMNVNELTSSLNEEQSKISHALSPLKSCNIVSVKKDGKERIYTLNKKIVVPVLKLVSGNK